MPREGSKYVKIGTQHDLQLSWRYLQREGSKSVNTGTQQGLKLPFAILTVNATTNLFHFMLSVDLRLVMKPKNTNNNENITN